MSPRQKKEPEAVASIRAILKGDLSTSAVADSIGELLIEGLNASKDIFATCPSCGKRHPVQLPDLGTRITAARALIEEAEGKLQAVAKSADEKIQDVLAERARIEDLTNDELMMLSIELEGPEFDLREEARKAARRVLAESQLEGAPS